MLKPRNPRSGGLNLRSTGKRLAKKNSLIRTCRFEQLEDRRMLAPLPTILIDDVQQVEGNSGTTDFVFTVTRSGKTNNPSTISYTTMPGSATQGEDYQLTSGTLVFASKQLTETITVPIVGDTEAESDETFYVELTIIENGWFGISRGVGTIVSDDGPSLPELAINDVQLVEGNDDTKAFVFTVTRSGALSQTSTVEYSTADGTATTSGNDYVAASGTLTFGTNDDTKTITIDVTGDTISEGSEAFYVDLSEPDNAVITVPLGTGVIVGDDGGLAPPQGLVSWWTADGTAGDLMQRNDANLVGGTTFATGMVGQAFDFDGVDDRVQVPDSESLKLTESLSIEGWVLVRSYPTSGGTPILFRGDDRGGLDPYVIDVRHDGNVRFSVTSLEGSAAVAAPVPLQSTCTFGRDT